MSKRGDATKARLLRATREVVAEAGYAHATTKNIARAAGIAEGTIYRHFSDKYALFTAAILESNEQLVIQLQDLPAHAGTKPMREVLITALTWLNGFREQVLPLELALLAEPSAARGAAVQAHLKDGTQLPGPPGALANYLHTEQRLGRLRSDLNCELAALTLTATLIGLALIPLPTGREAFENSFISMAVDLFLEGAQP